MPEGLILDAQRSTSHPPSIDVECWWFKSFPPSIDVECSTFNFDVQWFKSHPASMDVEWPSFDVHALGLER